MVATQVKVLLVNEQFMGEFYFRANQEQTARSLFKDGWYRTAGEFAVEGTDEAAAEEVFDLTNNPYRQTEREQLYGRGRSLSVGDIVEADGRKWLCCSTGWQALAV